MKRTLSIFLMICTVFTISSCGNTDNVLSKDKNINTNKNTSLYK